MEETNKKQKLGLVTGLYLVFAISLLIVSFIELNKMCNEEFFQTVFGNVTSMIIFIVGIIAYIICTFVFFFSTLINTLEEKNLENITEIDSNKPSFHRPAAISYLIYQDKTKGKAITSTILDLLNRGYLFLDEGHRIEEVLNPNLSIVINKNINADSKTLSAYERVLIRWLIDEIGDSKKVYTGVIRDNLKNNPLVLQKFKIFQNEIKSELVKDELYNENKKKSITPYIAIGLLLLTLKFNDNLNVLLIIFTIIHCLLLKIFFKDTKQTELTNKGLVLAEKWQGYKGYLEQKGQITIEDFIYKIALGSNIKEECLFKLDDVFKKERRK